MQYVHTSAQLCLTLGNPVDYSLPASAVLGILQARIPEWLFSTPGDVLDLGIAPTSLASPALAGFPGWRLCGDFYHTSAN